LNDISFRARIVVQNDKENTKNIGRKGCLGELGISLNNLENKI
jgi:hypothetical protein